MMSSPATKIMLPSIAAETNSIFPCPYGWSLSPGLAEIYKLNSPTNPATTLTMLSRASVNMATEFVRKYATSLAASNKTDTNATHCCTCIFFFEVSTANSFAPTSTFHQYPKTCRHRNDYPDNIDECVGIGSLANRINYQKDSADDVQGIKQQRIRFDYLIAVQSISCHYNKGSAPAQDINEEFQFNLLNGREQHTCRP